MAPTPGSAIFVDTNILIYATFPGSPFHSAARARLHECEMSGASLWVSRQVLREYLASTTRPGAIVPSPSISQVCKAVRQFEAEFEKEDSEVSKKLLELVESQGVQGKRAMLARML